MRYVVIGAILCLILGVYLQATRTVEKPGPGQVEVRFAFPADVTSLSTYARITRRFMELNPDIHVTLEPVVGDFRRVIQRDLVANIAPDVFMSDDDDFSVFASGGHYLSLDPLIKRDKFDLDAYYRPAIESFRWHEHQFGLPAVWGCSLIIYNKDLFREAGVTADPCKWTWAQFVDALKKLTRPIERNGRKVPCYGYIRDNSAHTMCHIWQSGGTILQRVLTCSQCGYANEVPDVARASDTLCKKCGKPLAGAKESWICKIDTPEAIRGVQFAVDLMKYAPRQQANNGSEQSMNLELFSAGQLAMLRGGPWIAAQLKDVDVNWDVGYYPAGPGGRWTRFYTDGFAIWSKTKHPNEAWRLMKFIVGPQAQRVFAKEARSVPVLKSVAESPAFNRPDTPWDESKFLHAIDHARFQRKIPQWNEIDQEIGRYMDLVMMPPGAPRRISAEQFCKIAQREIDSVLADACRAGGKANRQGRSCRWRSMNTWIAVTSYWTHPSSQPGPETVVFDHPTPLDSEGTLARTLASFCDLRGRFRVLVVAAAAHPSLAGAVHERVTDLIRPYAGKLDLYLASPVHLDALNTALPEPILRLDSYGNIRNVQLVVPFALGADAVVGIDDDEIIQDADYLDHVTAHINQPCDGTVVGGMAGPYFDAKGDWRLADAPQLADCPNLFLKKNWFMNEAIGEGMAGAGADGIVRCNVAFGGNMVMSRSTIARVCHDPYIPRGEDYDYVINAAMDGIMWYFCPKMWITHLPPDSTGSQAGDKESKLIADIYRFIYMREKMRYQRAHLPAESVDLDYLSPYPAPYLDDAADLPGEGIRALDAQYPGFRQAGGLPEQIVCKAETIARTKAAEFFAYRAKWRDALAGLPDSSRFTEQAARSASTLNR